VPGANESFRELKRSKEEVQQQIKKGFYYDNLVDNLRRAAREKERTATKSGLLGTAFMGISSLPFLLAKSNKRIINNYLNVYDLTKEQLEILNKAESNEERVRLLKAWEHTNQLKQYKQGGRLISKHAKGNAVNTNPLPKD